jgi:FkbM family methyltransferase
MEKLKYINTFLSKLGFALRHSTEDHLLERLSGLTEKLRFNGPEMHAHEDAILDTARVFHVRRMLLRMCTKLVVDVGANTGQFASDLRACNYRGKVVSVEPDPKAYSLLAFNHADGEFQTNINGAAGSVSQMVRFPISDSSVFNSFHAKSALGEKIFGCYMESHTTAQVQMNTLDDWLRICNVVPPENGVLLKTDTQGHDLEVLKGCKQLLKAVECIIIEIPVENIYEGAPTGLEIISELHAMNFNIAGLYPVSRIPGSERILEFDGIFVKSNQGYIP